MLVADMIETTRLHTGLAIAQPDPENPTSARSPSTGEGFALSPDGRRFVSIAIRGDIATDRVVVDVISARLDDLDAAANVRRVAQLSGRFLGSTDLVIPYERMFQWVNDHQIALRWEAEDGTSQVFSIDLDSGALEQLSHQPGGVAFFAINARRMLVYSATIPITPGPNLLETGGLIRAPDAYSLANGRLDGQSFLGSHWDRRWFIQAPGETPRPLDISGRGYELDQARLLSFSPDGRWLVMGGTPLLIPVSWDSYNDGLVVNMVEDERLNPRTGFLARQLQQAYLVDLQSGQSRTLLAAPLNFWTRFAWSSDSGSLVVGPTYLPTPTDAQGLAGKAMTEIDIPSGRARRIPVDEEISGRRALDRLDWVDPDLLVMENAGQRAAVRREGGRWRSVPVPTAVSAPLPTVRIEMRQDENTPPRLFAVDGRSGAERMIFDPNPGLTSRFALGHVERLLWEAPDGRRWSGMLYHPVGEQAGHRYPLVIQTHGHAGIGEFSLNGKGGSHPALGVGISVYAAQPLAGRGMFVLQMEDQSIPGGPAELVAYREAYESAIAELDRRGLIDTHRVGISGFSRTGWHALFALTHSNFEFAAALVSDNHDGSYFQGTMSPGSMQYELGALPFGAGLVSWLERSPGFSVERVRTPLRLQMESPDNAPALLNAWEIFSRLRHLGRPVEYNILPNALHGSHALQNPAQALASQQGAVEWFDYWLNGVEPAGAGAAERRAEFARLRDLRDAALAQPRAPLLDWSARAIEEPAPLPSRP
jgi:dienelactone hydrolase